MLAIAALFAPGASATTLEEAASLCTDELQASRGAVAVRDLRVRRESRVPYAYGYADFPDRSGVRFRCRVYQNNVTAVTFLVSSPSSPGGWAWSGQRPQGVAVSSPPDAEAEVTPEPESASAPVEPLFLRPGEKAADTPGVETGTPPATDTAAGSPRVFLRPGEKAPDVAAAEAETPPATDKAGGSPRLFLRPGEKAPDAPAAQTETPPAADATAGPPRDPSRALFLQPRKYD